MNKMLDQKSFGTKLRNHRKNLGMTQEEVAEMVGVSPQAISKWESGDCLPDCFNLKELSRVYRVSLDFLLETETDGDINTVAAKIEQLGTEFVWANVQKSGDNPHKQLGDDLWEMWKAIYFIEVGDKNLQQEEKKRGNLHIGGNYGLKIWDDCGIACVIKSSFIKNLEFVEPRIWELMHSLCSEQSLKLISALYCGDADNMLTKDQLCEKTGIELDKLNALLLAFIENGIIEFVADSKKTKKPGYMISGRFGMAAYMVMAAAYILGKKSFWLSEYINGWD